MNNISYLTQLYLKYIIILTHHQHKKLTKYFTFFCIKFLESGVYFILNNILIQTRHISSGKTTWDQWLPSWIVQPEVMSPFAGPSASKMSRQSPFVGLQPGKVIAGMSQIWSKPLSSTRAVSEHLMPTWLSHSFSKKPP